MEVDGRSVYVGNVDYGATAEELEQVRLITFNEVNCAPHYQPFLDMHLCILIHSISTDAGRSTG